MSILHILGILIGSVLLQGQNKDIQTQIIYESGEAPTFQENLEDVTESYILQPEIKSSRQW